MRSALFVWTGLGFAAFALLPWYLAADKGVLETLRTLLPPTIRPAACAPPRPCIGPGSGSCCSASRSALAAPSPKVGRGRLVGLGALIGLAGLLGSGFAIGASGWSFAWMSAAFGALAAGQPGLGLGGALTLLAPVDAPRLRPGRHRPSSAATPSSPARWSCARRCCCCSSPCRSRSPWPVPSSTMPAGSRPSPSPSGSATSASGVWAAWRAACAAASPGTRSSWRC